jgi:hypothetical protein
MAKRTPKAPKVPVDGRDKLLFATNRANVLSVLSSGLIRPRAAYEKYYDDLLALCPGNILLFHHGFPRSLVPLLCGDQAGLFSVLVEVDPKRLPATGKHTRLNTNLLLTSEKSASKKGALCDVIGSPIPIASVTRLCFESQENLDDFQARSFENVPALPPLAVVPSAFADSGPDPQQFRSALERLPAGAASSEDFRRLDAAMGATAMLSLFLPPSKEWISALAAAVTFPNTSRISAAGAPHWLTSLIESIVSAKTAKTDVAGTDERLMAAAVTVLRSMNPRDGWVESKVASDIASEALTGVDPNQAKEIESWRDVVIAVAKADKQIGSLDDSGSVVRRGLMLLVLRCQPERIVRAGDTAMKPGPKVTAIGGMLSGLFHGYSRLSSEMKAQSCPADLLSRLAVTWWSGVDGQKRKLAIGTSMRTDNPTAVNAAVTVEGGVFVERLIRPSDAMVRLFEQATKGGQALQYDADLNALVYQAGAEGGPKRRLIIESGPVTKRGQGTIRVRTECLTRDGKPVRLSKREDAVALLERNYDPSTQCRFAIEPVSGNLAVLIHQLPEAMEWQELHAHIEAVSGLADGFEAEWAKRPASPARAAAKRKTTSDT